MSDETNIDRFIGDRVRSFREDRNMSQAELARRMDITAPHVWNLENGLRAWTAKVAESAAIALGVDIRLLFPRRPHVKASDRAAG